MAAKFDKNKDGAITPDEVKGTPMEASFRAKDINGDGKITAEDIAAMKARMAKGENLLVAIRPGGEPEMRWPGRLDHDIPSFVRPRSPGPVHLLRRRRVPAMTRRLAAPPSRNASTRPATTTSRRSGRMAG